jgi:RNA polymerase sigma-70 factor, ECF subfamily
MVTVTRVSRSVELVEAVSPEDTDIVAAALKRGEYRDAIARCAREHAVALTRFCTALLGSPSEADEAVQETLLAAYDGASAFRNDAPVRGWLFGIARRLCARRLEIRTRQTRRRAMLVTNETAAGPDQALEDAQRGDAVRRAVEELRPTEREALLLRYDAELSYREVAEATGVDEAAARQRVSRALARVRARLAEDSR